MKPLAMVCITLLVFATLSFSPSDGHGDTRDTSAAVSAGPSDERQILITNVRIFDGRRNKRILVKVIGD